MGRLSDLYGRVRLFSAGFLVFAVGALLAGLAGTPQMLISFRVLQGMGAAILMNLSVAILTDNVPRTRLGTWLSVNQTAWRFGAVLGSTLSGVIIDYLGWRWIFLLQVPIAVLAYFWSLSRLREVYRPVEPTVIDWGGFALFTAFIISLTLGLTLIEYLKYRAVSYVFITSSLILLLLFALLEVRVGQPAMDFSLFRNWQFTGGVIAQVLYATAFGAATLLLSLYLQVVRHLSASVTGLYLLPFELTYLVFGVLGGRLTDMFGYAPVTITGLAIGSASLFLLHTLVELPSTPMDTLVIAIIMFGMGTGLFNAPNTSSIMSAVPPQRRGVASSMRSIMNNLGFIASLNLAILAMTAYVPYDVASTMIQNPEASMGSSYVENVLEFSRGLGLSFEVQSVVMALAIPFSLSRIRHGGVRQLEIGSH